MPHPLRLSLLFLSSSGTINLSCTSSKAANTLPGLYNARPGFYIARHHTERKCTAATRVSAPLQRQRPAHT